ncbi:MAG: class IV adenylate cyclase, partial [Candidatus Altarchaeaceae archaeon]
MIEVEVKAKIKNYEKFMKTLEKINAKFIKEEIQTDFYFNHPSRNFEETDEALRVRKINNKFYLTYKGKKIDNETKTRNEFSSICDEKIFDILRELGFRNVAKIEKHRIYYSYKNFEI